MAPRSVRCRIVHPADVGVADSGGRCDLRAQALEGGLVAFPVPPNHGVARIAPIVPAQSATDGGWSLASPVSTRITVTQPRSPFSTHRTATPPRYVLDSMPVSYESSLRF